MYAWEILSEAMRFGRWAKGTREPCVSCRHSVSWVHTGTSGGCQDLQQQLLLEQEREKTEAAFQISTSKNLLSVLQLNGCLRPLPYWDWINQPFTDSCGGPLCRLKHKHKKKQKTFFLIIDYFSIFKFLPEAQHEVYSCTEHTDRSDVVEQTTCWGGFRFFAVTMLKTWCSRNVLLRVKR